MNRYFYLLLLILLVPSCLFSQVSEVLFEHINVDKGLSQNTVFCIHEDKSGYMWFGTENGLNKYNGRNFEFEIYQHSIEDTNSLSNIWVNDIAEDNDGNLWIATRNGLNKLEIKTRKIKRYFHESNNKYSLNNNEILGVCVDKKGLVWVKTYDELSRLDIKTNKFIRYKHYNDYNKISRSIKAPILEDRDAILWIGTSDGLNLLDRKLGKYSRLKHEPANPNSLSDNYVNAICEDKNGFLWIGTNNGLNRYDKASKTFISFFNDEKNLNSICSNKISAVYEDSKGLVWIGTDAGISVYNPDEKSFISYINDVNNPTSLSNNGVLCFYESKSKIMWIGTDGGGVDKINMKSKKFNLFKKSPSFDISNDIIASMFIDDEGLLWVGTYGGGLNIINRKTGEIKKYFADAGRQRLLNNYVHSIIKDSNGKIWLATRNGINIFDKKTETLSTMQDYIPATRYSKNFNLTDKRIYTLLEDKQKNVWITTEKGLYRINLITHRIHEYLSEPNNTVGLCHERTQDIIQDREGNIWIGTQGGLNKYDPAKNTFTQYQHKINDPYSLNDNNIYAVFEDSEGYIWIGTVGSGLNKFDKKTGRFKYYTEKEGLPNGTIYEILEDKNHDLWLSTGRGLAKFNRKEETFNSFSTEDGLQSMEFNNGAVCKSKDGELFFGGISGFNSFYPDQIKYNPYIPNVVLTKFEKIGKEGKQIIYLDDIKELEISYLDYSFSISFAALEFTKPEKNHYSYMMENLKDEWIDLGNKNSVNFTNIPAGEYYFKVKGSNNDQKWNENPVVLKIVIKPPFWLTKWAYSLYVLIILIGIYGVVQMRTKKFKSANKELREKHRLAEELNKLSVIAQKTDNAIVVFGATGRPEWVNEGFTRVYGYTLDEFIEAKGGNFFEMVSANDVNESIKEFLQYKKTVTYVVQLSTKLNTKIWIQTTLTPILNEQGEIQKILAIDSDINKLKEAEFEILEQQEKLQTQSNLLSLFNKDLEKKNAIITDSIDYSRRIQSSILPDTKLIRKYFEKSFIFYKPRDVVSGDFPWLYKKDNILYIAAVDCTGHGVPGALLSFVCFFTLNNIVSNDNGMLAGDILDMLHQEVRKTLKQDSENAETRDGMDIALCKIVFDKNEIHFAGAHRPLYYLKNKELTEFKGDRMAIGGIPPRKKEEKKFTNNKICFEAADKIFLFTDGLSDQFQDTEEKQKYSTLRIKETILEHADFTMSELADYFANDFDCWKGNNKQTDDILLIGIEL